MLTNGIIRSFNPIGQGAFVTEHFYRNGKEYTTVIFDAGFLKTATRGGEKRAKRVIQNVLAKEVPISAIFISHLDEDHVGLVPYILDKYPGQVKNIILPRFSKEIVFAYLFWYSTMEYRKGRKRWSKNLTDLTVEIARRFGYISGDDDEPSDQMSRSNLYFIEPHEGDEPSPFREDDIRAIDLGQEEGLGRTNYEPSGSVFRLAGQDCYWYFVPYHREVRDEKNKAEHFWKQIIYNFHHCFEHIDYAPEFPFFNNERDASKKLKELSKCVLKKEGGYRQLARIYKEIWGDRNIDSMVVVSFPSRDCNVVPRCPIDFLPVHFQLYRGCAFPVATTLKPGAIYTGDSNASELPLQVLLGNSYLSQSIGSVQVPHHGSIKSWDVKLVSANATLYFASYGTANTYGHPAPKVIWDIIRHFKMPLFCNEYSQPHIQMYAFI